MIFKTFFKRRSRRPYISVLNMADGSKKYVVRYYQQTWAGACWGSSEPFISLEAAQAELDQRLGQTIISSSKLV